ncbi:MAG: ATP-dependent zinc metalloprotease FtsH [Candidatus Muirbacterium halophilum]|nr:ATP-dependent zinc metalloprotease FtsH [Candidatus Muirbacterium halophilum]MCK9475347.1 ATP-dependent zinc metalloprotease FtsH [Candidatus Muirbacterium halophilum]
MDKNRKLKTWILYTLIIVVLVLILNEIVNPQGKLERYSYSMLKEAITENNVEKLQIVGNKIRGRTKSNTDFESNIHPMFSNILAKMIDEKASRNLVAEPEPTPNLLVEMLINFFPFLLFIVFWFYILNKMNGSGTKAMSFGKSKAKFIDPSAQKTSFKDVAGCDEAKNELEEVIEFLKAPKKFQILGGKIPKGVLLVGPPGTGKTLLARAVAGEAKVPFLHISGSDFVEMFVGVGASRVRDLFSSAEKRKPCIVFIDEIDAVGRQRGSGLGGGHDEREQTLNQLLVQMDGFEANTGIVVIAATNRPDILDPALLRPGRFDRQIVVDFPDIKGRYHVLKVHTKNIPLSDDVDLNVVARTTPGLSGADLANLCNEAALLAARENLKKVSPNHFEEARDKITMGVERKSKVISDEEKEITAWHEAGHALISKLVPDSDPLHKVTIIPRGRALGVTHSIPEKDRYLYSKNQFLSIIKKAYGGRCAEEIKFNLLSTGASNDISVATNIAHNMVVVYGMSEKFGPISFGKREQHYFLGKEIAQIKDYSEKTAHEIDIEVRKIIMECYDATKKLLEENFDKLEKISLALLKYETLDSSEVDILIAGGEIDRVIEPLDIEEPKEKKESKEKIVDDGKTDGSTEN